MKNLMAVCVLLMLAACASTPKVDSHPANVSAKSNADDAAMKAAAELEARKLADEVTALQKQSVYFGFDKFSIKPEYRDVVQQQANFLKAHSNDIVTVQGNTDERGSDEYNLSLGDKRANAASNALKILGVPASQINTASLGESKPRLTCHAEKCWKENRRDDFSHKIN